MYPTELTLASRHVLRRAVRESIARAIETSAEGELVEKLAFELGRALRREGRALRGVTRRGVLDELERSGRDLLETRDRTSQDLEDAQSELSLHRVMLDDAHGAMVRRAVADGPVLDEELRESLGALFDSAAAGRLSLDELRYATFDRVRKASDAARAAMLAAWEAERDRQVDLLRRRLDKVNRSLAASEQALSRLAAQREIDPGIASIYRTVQGLDAMTPDASRKRMMLAEIYQANLELRKQLSSA